VAYLYLDLVGMSDDSFQVRNKGLYYNNAQLLALSGLRSPYAGKLGVVEEGALADLLLVDGNPLEDIKLIEDPAKNFLLIMKDGKLYKNLAAR